MCEADCIIDMVHRKVTPNRIQSHQDNLDHDRIVQENLGILHELSHSVLHGRLRTGKFTHHRNLQLYERLRD